MSPESSCGEPTRQIVDEDAAGQKVLDLSLAKWMTKDAPFALTAFYDGSGLLLPDLITPRRLLCSLATFCEPSALCASRICPQRGMIGRAGASLTTKTLCEHRSIRASLLYVQSALFVQSPEACCFEDFTQLLLQRCCFATLLCHKLSELELRANCRLAYFLIDGRIGFSALGGAIGLVTGISLCRGGSIGLSADGGLFGRSDGPGKSFFFLLKGFGIIHLLSGVCVGKAATVLDRSGTGLIIS